MDGALAVQHAIRLSNERKQPLCVCKLDISEAFDAISHSAVAVFLQGAPYSAELFTRVVDLHLGTMHLQWQLEETTWVQTYMCCVFLVLYADDIAILATSCEQLTRTRMAEELRVTLALISLRKARS